MRCGVARAMSSEGRLTRLLRDADARALVSNLLVAGIADFEAFAHEAVREGDRTYFRRMATLLEQIRYAVDEL